MTLEDLLALRPADASSAAARDAQVSIASAKTAAEAELATLTEQRPKILLTLSSSAILERDQRRAELGVWLEQLTVLEAAVAEQEVKAVRQEKIAALRDQGERANRAVAAANAKTTAGYAALVKAVADFIAISAEAGQLVETYRLKLLDNQDLAAELPVPASLTPFSVAWAGNWYYRPLRDCVFLPKLDGVSPGVLGSGVSYAPPTPRYL